MASNITIKQHDTWPPISAGLADAEDVIDLTTAATVKLLAKTATGGATFEGPCTIVDAAGGVIAYEWDPADTATVNTYNAEFEITWGSGEVQTVPNDGYFTITVMADLG